MTDITTPAQMREAAARLIDDRCADILGKQDGKTPEVDQNLRLMAVFLPDLAAAIRALPVAEPEPVAVNAVMCAAERDAQSRDAVDLTLFRQAIRAEALEEAAKLPPYDCDGDPAGSFDHHVFVKRDAIRALISQNATYWERLEKAEAERDALRAAQEEIADGLKGIARDIQIGPDDEGREIYDMVQAMQWDARQAMKGQTND